MRTDTNAALPVRYRLVNPPPAFTGRSREQAWLRDAILRGPAVLVYGLGGMGKTSLVLRTLHAEFPEHVERTILLALTASDVREQLVVELLRALSLLRGIEHIDWKGLLANAETALEVILDLAEQSQVWVVIDDLHHAPIELTQRFLATITSYARKSRWIAMSRADPNVEILDGQCLRLGGMPEADLLVAGRILWPAQEDAMLRRAVVGAGGSPWRMKQLLKGDAPEGSLLPELPAKTDAFVTILHALFEPLPLSLVQRVEHIPPPNKLVELERLGIVERTSEGYRLHEAARSLLDAAVKVDRSLHRRIAEVLSQEDEPRVQLLALRHYYAAGDAHAASALLATTECDLLAAGYSRELWSILASQMDASVAMSRLRCAVDLGDAGALAAATAPISTNHADQLLWARRLHMLGHLAEALAVARAVHSGAAAAGERATALEAGLVCALVLAQSGDAAGSLKYAEALSPVRPEDQTRIDAIRVRCFGDLGMYDEAVVLCDKLRTRLHDLDISTRIEICHQVAFPTLACGYIKLANSIFDLVPYNDTDRTLSTHHSQLFLTVRTGAAIAAGRLGEARLILDKLGPFREHESLLQPAIDILECARRIMTGEFDGLEDLLHHLARRAGGRGDAYAYAMARSLDLVLDMLFARPAPTDDSEQTYLGIDTPNGLRYSLWKRRLELRSAATDLLPSMPLLEQPMGPEEALIVEQVFAIGHLVRDEYEAAVARARHAIAIARQHGHTMQEALSLLILCDCLLAAGRLDEAHDAAEAATALVEPSGSERLSATAQFAVMLARGEPLDPALLERFAKLGRVAPDVARRAQALLGASSTLDAVERRVHQAVVARAVGQIRTIHAIDGVWRAGWGIDRRRRRAWLPSGRVVSFDKSPLLWRVLDVLVERRQATKEQIVREVWNEREYHPLRHNNRLFATVNKLRQLIEDSPAAPSRIVTGADSYGLGSDEPVRVLD